MHPHGLCGLWWHRTTKFPNGVNLKAQMQGYYLRESNLTTLLATETISVLQDNYYDAQSVRCQTVK